MSHQKNLHIIESIKKSNFDEIDFQISISNQLGIVIGYLKPITYKLIGSDENLVPLLTKWRKMFKKFFLTQFIPSNERTQRWLEEVVLKRHDRLLFIIYTDELLPIGNFGICNVNDISFELDNLIRGEKGGDSRLIYYAEISLLHWAFLNLQSQFSTLHVFSSNSKTIALHKEVGFKVTKEYPLRRETNEEGEILYSITEESTGDVDFSYLEMSISRDEFFSRYNPDSVML
jgi:hypothetical protein